jgi:hypothetical protein
VPPYVRPAIAPAPALDDAGVPYGSRWGDDGPPDSAYSVTSHLERFAPLHAVADALVAHLAATHDVTAFEGADPGIRDPHPDAVRTVRLVPRVPRDGGRELALEYTAFPGVIVHVPGPRPAALPASAHPPCGCDACDDSWEDVAERLEDEVLTLAGERPGPPVPSGRLLRS